MHHRDGHAVRRLALVALAFGASACAFSYRGRAYPEWQAPGSARGTPFQCGKATPVIVKTGKTGMGVTIVFEGGETTCALALDGVVLRVEGREVSHAQPPPMPTLGPGIRVEIYFPLPFDGNASFNAGERHGTLALRHGAETTTFVLELVEKGPFQ